MVEDSRTGKAKQTRTECGEDKILEIQFSRLSYYEREGQDFQEISKGKCMNE